MDLINENGVKKRICNIDDFCNTVSKNPIIRYFTYDAENANIIKVDIDEVDLTKDVVRQKFDRTPYFFTQSEYKTFFEIQKLSEKYNQHLKDIKFKNCYNPFSEAHKRNNEAVGTFLWELAALGVGVSGIAFNEIVLTLSVGAAFGFVEYARNLAIRTNKGILQSYEEPLKKYDKFQENLKNATIEAIHFPEAEKKVTEVRNKQEENILAGLPFDLDYNAFNYSLIKIYGVKDYRYGLETSLEK